MPYLTIDAHWPLLVVRRVGVADAASVSSMLAWTDRHLRSTERPIGWVYDAGETPGGLPDPGARKAAGEWLGRHQTLLREKCVGIEFAFANPVARGALTAVFWIAQPPVAWTMHASLRAAVESSIARLGDGSLDASRIVAAIGRTPSV